MLSLPDVYKRQIQSKAEFRKPGLVITDEQHRFGVRQRQILSDKGDNPNVLVMTATPIPRTLALIFYGDLDISVIDSLPPGRQQIDTFAVNTGYRERYYNFIDKELEKGRQAYIICACLLYTSFSEGKKAESDLLAEYIEKIPDTACIVFSEEKADKRMKLYKAAEKHGIVKTYNGLKDVDLANMIEKKFAKSGIKATKAVCVYMVRNCGENAETLKNETDKIISYLGDRNEVKTEDIDKLCSKSSETKVFDLVDAMIAGKTEKALEIYRTLLSLNESPYMLSLIHI